MIEGARVAVARAWPGSNERICILTKSPEDFSWSGRTGIWKTLRDIMEEQSRQGGWGQIGKPLSFRMRCSTLFAQQWEA